jgi:hypothetical protein
MNEVVKIPKILTKMSVEDAKIHQKRPYCEKTFKKVRKYVSFYSKIVRGKIRSISTK